VLRHAPDASVNPVQFVILPPENANFTADISFQAISPDGRQIVFAAVAADGLPMLWVRPLDSLTARPLAGTEGANDPFWSPTSGSIGFFAQGKLKRIDVAGGLPQTLADASFGLGGTWSKDGVILFSPNLASPLLQIPAGGGTAKPATSKDERRRDRIHMGPSFLPDGRHFLFWAGPADPGVYIGSLDSKDVNLVLHTDSAATYSPLGYLLFMRETTLMAQPFDTARMSKTGDPMPVAEQVSRSISQAGFSISNDGVLVFRSAGAGQTELVWVDRTGRRIAVVAPPGSYGNVALSPDENHVAFNRNSGAGNPDVWLMDLRRHVTERFTFQPSVDNVPVWSADGRTIAFASERGGGLDIYQRSTNGSGPDELLLKLDASPIMFPSDWSSDGRYLTYYRTDAKTLDDIWALPLFGERRPFPVLNGEFNESQSQFSPEVKWIAYVSDESGTPQVYVQSFPTLTGKLQISTEGGTQPRWRRDGRGLFYLAPNRKLMEVTIKTGPPFEAGTPQPLFGTNLDGVALRQTYAVSSDGNRFLLNVAVEGGAPPLRIVLNWPALLKK
jgi:Tol biopolymer transport system component